MSKTRKRYDATFKSKAVELSYARGNVREIAEELGVDPVLLYRWRREKSEFEHNSFPGRGKAKLTDEQREIAELKAKLKDALLERDILKKAISIFSVSDKKSSGL
jgi:transposase